MDGALRVGPWLVQPVLNTISRNGTTVRLEPKQMEVLVCLSRQPGQPVSKGALLRAVWPDTFVSDDVLTRSIFELRRVFEDDVRKPRFIETIPRRGYRLVAPVEQLNGDKAAKPGLSIAEPFRRIGNWNFHWLPISLVLLCGVLVVFTVIVRKFGTRIARTGPPIRSLAVLPLKNLSDDPTQKYFAAGMTEELITDLSQISALRIISRTSSDQYEDTHKSLPEIARELHVDAIVEGSVVRSGNRVRITAQLIYAPEDKNLWARSYERDVQDALALQGRLANAIADEVRVQVSPQEQERLHTQHSVSPKVLENYLEGNYHLHRAGLAAVDEEHHRAEKYFQLAINEDPNFAPAYIGLAYAHGLILSGSGIMNPSPRDYEIRRAAAEKAAALAPQSSEAHELLGNVAAEDWRWPDAEEELQRAIALSPNRAQAHDVLAFFLYATGRKEEGLKETHIAQELDPKSDRLAGILFDEGKYDEAIQLQINDLQRQPDDGYAHYALFQAYALAGRYPESIHELGEAGKLFGFAELAPEMNTAFKAGGFKSAVRSVAVNIERLQKAGQVYMPDVLAEFYGIIGDKDRAFYWLEDEYRHKHSTGAGGGLVWLKGNPMYAILRSDPRYADLVQRVGLSP